MKIWKYELPAKRGEFSLELPIGWQKLDTQVQGDTPMMWCRVNEKITTEIVRFKMLFTGDEWPADPECEYMATFQLGYMVYHLFKL